MIDRTAEATGVGRATVIRIKREMNEKEKFESPEKRYRKSRVLINVEDFDCGVIRKTVKEFYENKTYPTLDKLLTKLKEKNVFKGGRSTLARVLKSMGFRYKMREDGKRYLYKQP